MALHTRFLALRAVLALVLLALSLVSEVQSASLASQGLLARSPKTPTARLGKTELLGSWRESPDGDQLEFFGGIPYAQPPLGKLRFEPPVLFKGFKAPTFDATHYGPACLQIKDVPSGFSEDCLTLNVIKPKGLKPGAKLPVMVYIHGGGFMEGRSEHVLDGSGIVSRSLTRGTPIIFASINYRLGPLGFPQGLEAQERGSLNLGLKDQLLALQWIRNNIKSFGGDKSKVTIFGQSAGGMSIGDLLLSPTLPRLIHSAILQSGVASSLSVYPPTHPNREQLHTNFVQAVPACAHLAQTKDAFSCLKSKDVDTATLREAWLSAAGQAMDPYTWGPNIDGEGGLIPDLPSRLLERGAFARVPVIAGTTLDEGTSFTTPGADYNDAVVRGFMQARFVSPTVPASAVNEAVDGILDLYPDIPALGAPIGTGNETWGFHQSFKRAALLNNDSMYQAPRRMFSQATTNAGVRNYGYLFTDPQLSWRPETPWLGVKHSDEQPYVYGLMNPNVTEEARELSKVIRDYWISFATSLDPNDGKGTIRPKWKPYGTDEEGALLELHSKNTAMITDDYRKEQIGFINERAWVFHQ